jgi:3-oxoisoapionate decarboxylase
MNPINRRAALRALSLSGAGLYLQGVASAATEGQRPLTNMGIVIYALALHQKYKWAVQQQGTPVPLALLEESYRLGAAGIQVELSTANAPHAEELRRRSDQYGMYVEASIRPPQSSDDVARFEADVRVAKSAGASLARTVIMPGRRYEQFKSLADFRDFEQKGLQALQWAEPVLARNQFRLAVENHKDQRVPEKLATIKRVSSEWIGICVDIGNSFTLLEDPIETARGFAPWAFTAHFKDQAVRENPEGFWYADVALGQGFLDLSSLVQILRSAKPDIHLNLELITRDPLNVPYLKNEFWITLPDLPTADLVRTLRVLKSRSSPKPFPLVSSLSPKKQLALELTKVQQSLAYARNTLRLV